jgi:hypothetical protein
MAARKTYLTACALALVAKVAVLGTFASISSDAGASKPCSPDPAVPCVSPPQPIKLPKALPSDLADVVGRDLNFGNLEFLGHIGLFSGTLANKQATGYKPWIDYTENDGKRTAYPDRVFEMLDNPSGINISTVADFQSRTSYWGSFYYKDWSSRPGVKPCVAITGSVVSTSSYCDQAFTIPAKVLAVSRAVYISRIGATYTQTPFVREAKGEMRVGYTTTFSAPIKGQYRCDTFIGAVFRSAGLREQVDYVVGTPAALTQSLYRRQF